jgi:hypothetical protein
MCYVYTPKKNDHGIYLTDLLSNITFVTFRELDSDQDDQDDRIPFLIDQQLKFSLTMRRRCVRFSNQLFSDKMKNESASVLSVGNEREFMTEQLCIETCES